MPWSSLSFPLFIMSWKKPLSWVASLTWSCIWFICCCICSNCCIFSLICFSLIADSYFCSSISALVRLRLEPTLRRFTPIPLFSTITNECDEKRAIQLNKIFRLTRYVSGFLPCCSYSWVNIDHKVPLFCNLLVTSLNLCHYPVSKWFTKEAVCHIHIHCLGNLDISL